MCVGLGVPFWIDESPECLQSGWKILPVAQCVAGGFAHLPHAGWCAVWYRFLATLYNVRASREMATAVREGGARAAVRLSGPRPRPPFPARAEHVLTTTHLSGTPCNGQYADARRGNDTAKITYDACTPLRASTSRRAHASSTRKRTGQDAGLTRTKIPSYMETRSSGRRLARRYVRKPRVSIPRLPIARATLSPCTCPSPPRTGLSSRRRCM